MWKLYLGAVMADVPVFMWDKKTGAIGILAIILVAFIIMLHRSTG